eukprot:1134682-Pyramimonas_sp.AAC.2
MHALGHSDDELSLRVSAAPSQRALLHFSNSGKSRPPALLLRYEVVRISRFMTTRHYMVRRN